MDSAKRSQRTCILASDFSLYSSSSMEGAGQHKELPEIRLIHLKLRLSPSGSFCIRLPVWGVNDLAEVRIMFFATCCPLSYNGPSARPILLAHQHAQTQNLKPIYTTPYLLNIVGIIAYKKLARSVSASVFRCYRFSLLTLVCE